jgi:peptide/nickel transport system permease protein
MNVMKRSIVLIAVGAAIVLLIAFCALFAPQLTAIDPNEMHLPDRLQAPSSVHFFGTDENGSDIFSRMLYGSRVSLIVGFSVVLISGVIGLLLGSLAGFFGGTIDFVITRMMDMLYAFPGFLLALSLVAVLGPSLKNLIIAMCVTGWGGFARLVRGEMLYLREKEYVLTARALGAGACRQIVMHIWPNLLGLVLVQATFAMAGTITAEAGLSFLGLGVPSTIPTWGALLNSGRKFLSEAPYLSLIPGLGIVLLVFGLNIFGDGLRALLDPRQKSQKSR